MAEFSKQFVQLHMDYIPWDFDLEKEFKDLKPGYYKPLICEGYGFRWIEKKEDGSRWCIFVKDDERPEIPYEGLEQHYQTRPIPQH